MKLIDIRTNMHIQECYDIFFCFHDRKYIIYDSDNDIYSDMLITNFKLKCFNDYCKQKINKMNKIILLHHKLPKDIIINVISPFIL